MISPERKGYLFCVLNAGKTKACVFSELPKLELQRLSPYTSLTRKRARQASQTLANTSEDLGPALLKLLGVWYGEIMQLFVTSIKREVLFLPFLIGAH